jgi:hypothetical protein
MIMNLTSAMTSLSINPPFLIFVINSSFVLPLLSHAIPEIKRSAFEGFKVAPT